MTRGVRTEVREIIERGRRAGQTPWIDGVDLRGKDLSEMDLRGTRWLGMDLRGVRMSGALLTGARMADVDLRDSDLSGANLGRAEMDGVRLTGADLTDIAAMGLRHRGVDELLTIAGATGAELLVYPSPRGWMISGDGGPGHPLPALTDALAITDLFGPEPDHADEMMLLAVLPVIRSWTATRGRALERAQQRR